ncbi:hypothetical protein [Amycolatopsis sp. NPDC003861]
MEPREFWVRLPATYRRDRYAAIVHAVAGVFDGCTAAASNRLVDRR